MSRRNRLRTSRPSPSGFSLADMRDPFTKAVEDLTGAIAEQNPNIDADGFETELRDLVLRYGKNGAVPVIPGFPTLAAAQPTPTPEYSMSGDLLVAAHEQFVARNFNGFYQCVRDAFRAGDVGPLMAALAEMNAASSVGVMADQDAEFEAGDLGDEDTGTDFLSLGDDSDFDAGDPAYGDDDAGFEIDGTQHDPLGRDPIMAGIDGFSADAGDNTGGEDPSVPTDHNAPGSDAEAQRRALAAFINRASLDGSAESRRKVLSALRDAS